MKEHKAVFFSPHNDDEALFGAYTLMRYRPLVVNTLWCDVQESRGADWPRASTRARESHEAMKCLELEHQQWGILESDPDIHEIVKQMMHLCKTYQPTLVFAPAIEKGGHRHHNLVAMAATAAFPKTILKHYLTYTEAGKSTSDRAVVTEPSWPEMKIRLLGYYISQSSQGPGAQPHFFRDQMEYYE